MSNPSKYNNPQQHLSEADMIRYKEGQMTDAEMHKVEKHLLDCELCNDAYEGFLSLTTNEYVEGIHQLKADFSRKNNSPTPVGFPWKWVAAASILLIMVLSFALIFSVGTLKEEKVAENKAPKKTKEVIDDEPIVAENIQDTILNHHFAINDPSLVEKKASRSSPPAINSSPLEERVVLDQKTKKEEKEIIALAESLPMEEEIVVMDQEVEPLFEESNFPSAAPAPDQNRKVESTVRRSKQYTIDADKIISGKVVDDTGEPLPGVSVIVKGTNKGAITDIEGYYQIPLKHNEKVLVFNYIGFTTQEREILNDQEQIVELEPDLKALSEVVVVGYGSNSAGTTNNVDQKINPKPAIGMRKYRKTLKENIRYPAAALEKNIEGNVILQFEVNTDGSLSNFNVIKSLGHGLDEEAIRLVQEGSQWRPATLNGNPVRETVKLRIPFKIRNR